jgi:hypothetical protein
MRQNASRRQFLSQVGKGMVVASIGLAAAQDMGLASRALAIDGDDRLNFGKDESLVDFIQSTPADKLLPLVHAKWKSGTSLKQIIGAAALANARAFGGEDYVGFHTLMALAPAFYMSQELPDNEAPLPVFKVLHRNARRLDETGGHTSDVLHAVAPEAGANPGMFDVREAARRVDHAAAERILATFAQKGAKEAFNALLLEVEDETEVHRVNLPYRAWDLLGIVGEEHALSMLRQSLRYCIKAEPKANKTTREGLAKAFDQHKLEGMMLGNRTGDDAWLEAMCKTLLSCGGEGAMEAAAAALKEGFAPESICQAAAIAANQIVLRDPGRKKEWSSPEKPEGSVHGDSVGVHSSDAVNAWRNIARVANDRNKIAASLLVAYQVARDAGHSTLGKELAEAPARPFTGDLERCTATSASELMATAEAAIRSKDQALACAAVHKLALAGGDGVGIFAMLRKYAISEDGALHAEKYYRTVTDEFSTLPSKFRGNELAALARVTASEYGYAAPGYAQSRELLGLG